MTSKRSKSSGKAVNNEELRLLMEEVARRQHTSVGTDELCQEIYAELFEQQRDFVLDPSKRKATLGSRRAGKTSMWARYSTVTALKTPRCLIRIWHSSRLRAKEMLWAELNYLHGRHGIKTESNETTLTITFANGAEIRLVGADKDKEAQKKRGDKTALEIILEAQNFGGFLRSMIDDVIEPSTVDLDGTVCMEGTPGPLCQGVWFEISGDSATARRWVASNPKVGPWSCHRWTLLDNPHVANARAFVTAAKKRRNWADDNPTYLREYCGIWVSDLTALFYRFDMTRNTYAAHEVKPYGPGWTHVLGWDLGFRDAMAVVIWGWHPSRTELFEVWSWNKSGAIAADVMSAIEEVEKRLMLNIVKRVADTGGGGRMYVEEVMSRYTQHFEAAKKTDKYEHVMLFNDEMTTGRIKLKLGSVYQEEIAGLMRDPNWPPPETPDKYPREAQSMPNHNCDAGLYGWRAATPYIQPYEAPAKISRQDGPRWVEEALAKLDKKAQTGQNDGITYGFGASDGDNFEDPY